MAAKSNMATAVALIGRPTASKWTQLQARQTSQGDLKHQIQLSESQRQSKAQRRRTFEKWTEQEDQKKICYKQYVNDNLSFQEAWSVAEEERQGQTNKFKS